MVKSHVSDFTCGMCRTALQNLDLGLEVLVSCLLAQRQISLFATLTALTAEDPETLLKPSPHMQHPNKIHKPQVAYE